MNKLKFSCPACGEHLECDEGLSGSSIQCPTCQRGIVVPLSRTLSPLDSGRTHSGAIGEESKTSGLAISSITLSLAGLIYPGSFIAGIICGHLAKTELKRDTSLKGRGLANTGLIAGYSILALIVSVMLYLTTVYGRVKDRSQETSCHNNLKYILLTQQTWGDDHHKTSKDTVTLKDVEVQMSRALKVYPKFLTCPSGGTYRLTVVGEPPTCSMHGESPPIMRAGRQVFP